jgi:maltose-binding protein MalE
MIDAKGGFTDTTGIAVSLKLVAGGSLLPSILSRKGPDVYLGLGAAETINYAIRDAVIGVNGLDPRLTDEQNAIFTTERYTYRNADGTFDTVTEARAGETPSFVTNTYNKVVDGNFAQAALDTVTISPGMVKDEKGGYIALPAAVYGIPRTMQFSMMFYRMDVLANIGYEVPESWDDLLSILPVLQSNNMQIGVAHIAALDFMIYQKGGSFWKYTNTEVYDDIYAGARVDLDSEVALEAFDFTCRLYSDY